MMCQFFLFRSFRWVLLGLLAGFNMLNPVWADYLVEPLRLELKMPPAKPVITTSVVVRNTGNETIRLKAYASNWTLDSAGGLKILEEPIPNGLADSIRYNPKEFEIPPGQSQIVRMAISVPASTAGEYRGILFFEDEKTLSQALQTQAGTSASLIIKKRLGVTTYVFKGDIQSQLKVEDFKVEREQNKLKASFTLLDSGQRHYRGIGNILISRLDASNGKAAPVREIPVNDGVELVILPGDKREVQQLLLPSDELPELPQGRYRAELILKNQTEGNTAPSSTTTDFDWQ